MVRGGKVNSKRSFRKRVQSKEDHARSDDSDEDYVVSDASGDVSDCPEKDCFSLDACASEDSLDDFIEEEEEEEIQRVRKFNRSRANNGVRHQRKNASKTSRKRARITYAEQLDQEEEEEKKQEGDGDYDDDDGDGDFIYDDDEEFTPEEEDYSDEEEETKGRKKKNNGMKMGKKALQKKVSVTSNRGRKRKNSRVSKKPLRKRRRKNGGSRGKVQRGDADDFIENDPAIRINSRKKSGRERRRLLLEDSNSDSDWEFTISEEEREQVREAMKLCGSLKRNSRSAPLRMKDEEVGAHDNLHQQRKPPGWKGKEKIEESQGRKGKEKLEDLKSEVGKQVCGICLSEENKRRARGVLNCCTHYFCFACIMEWSKVESRCPLCKQRFKTISKHARSTTAIGLREVVIQVPERNQVYQPTEEELRSYIDPYEAVICSECREGGDDGLMLLCDICDSPAHTYCVGLGREVPEGNWYCNGCRPVGLLSNSQVQECVPDSTVTTQSQPARRPSPVPHIQEIIDLNLVSSSRTSFGQGFRHLSSSRFSIGSVEGASPISGGGAATLSTRRWIHRHIQQILSMDRMSSTTGRTNGVSATSSMGNSHCSQIDQSREPATQHTRTQDVGTSYHTFFEETLCNNISPLMQNGDPFSTRISNSRTPEVQDSTTFANRPVNGVIWPELLGTPTLSDYEPVHQFSSRSNIVTDGSLLPAIKEDINFHMVKEQLQSMVKSHLQNLSRDIDLGYSTFKEIARSSTHTILAACGLEHKKSEVCTVPPPSVCSHIELMAGGQTSMMKGCCSSCFDSFLRDVVQRVLDTRITSQWLRLGL